MTEDKQWFRAKKYGYGWVPSSWQGWLVTLVYSVYTAAVTIWFVAHKPEISPSEVWLFIALVTLGIAVLTRIAYAKGEPAKWRWGGVTKDQPKR